MCGSPWDCQETLQVLSSQDCTPSTASIPRYAYLFERKLLRIPWRACIVDLASFFKDNFAHLSVKGLPVWLEQMFHHTHIGQCPSWWRAPRQVQRKQTPPRQIPWRQNFQDHADAPHGWTDFKQQLRMSPCQGKNPSESFSANALPTLPKNNAFETKWKHIYIYIYIYVHNRLQVA